MKLIFGKRDYKITVYYGEIEIPPEEDRQRIIAEYHSSVVGLHKGCSKTYGRIRQDFYWANVQEQVRSYVKNREDCKKGKLVRLKTKQPMKITDTPSQAFDKIEIDIVGPLPVTERGNKYILSIQDTLTKYSDGIPLINIESTTIALTLAGSNFISDVMVNFCRIFKIKQIKSTAFHLQSLGSLERSHHVLIQNFKMYCEKSNWDVWLRFALFSYNTSIQEGTGLTPHELIFGKRPRYHPNSRTEKSPSHTTIS